MKKIVTFLVLCGVGIILHLLTGRLKGNFRITFNLLEDEERYTTPPSHINTSISLNHRTGPHQSNSQSSEAPSERHFPTVHSKSANLPENASLTDEKNRDAPVYNGHRNICEILLNESGSDYSSDYLEDCVRLVDSHPRLYEFLIKTKQYIGWYRKRVKELNKSIRGISDERTLVGTCLNPRCGGYGTQMFSLGFAFVLAVATERLLLLKWPESPALRSQLQDVRLDIFSPTTFDWSAFDNDIHIDKVPTSKTDDLCSEALSPNKKTVIYDIRHFWKSKRDDCARRLGYADIGTLNVAQIWNTTSGINFNVSPLFILIRMLFKFGEPVRKVVRKFWELQGLKGNVEYGAVHIRTGVFDSGINETLTAQSDRFLSTKDEWKKQIECALKIKKEKCIDVPLFLASDSTDCKNWAKETYKDKIITLDVIPKHVVKDKYKRREKTPEEYKQEAVMNVADLALMAHAQLFFPSSNSTFSRLSSYLGDLSSKQMYQCTF